MGSFGWTEDMFPKTLDGMVDFDRQCQLFMAHLDSGFALDHEVDDAVKLFTSSRDYFDNADRLIPYLRGDVDNIPTTWNRAIRKLVEDTKSYRERYCIGIEFSSPVKVDTKLHKENVAATELTHILGDVTMRTMHRDPEMRERAENMVQSVIEWYTHHSDRNGATAKPDNELKWKGSHQPKLQLGHPGAGEGDLDSASGNGDAATEGTNKALTSKKDTIKEGKIKEGTSKEGTSKEDCPHNKQDGLIVPQEPISTASNITSTPIVPIQLIAPTVPLAQTAKLDTAPGVVVNEDNVEGMQNVHNAGLPKRAEDDRQKAENKGLEAAQSKPSLVGGSGVGNATKNPINEMSSIFGIKKYASNLLSRWRTSKSSLSNQDREDLSALQPSTQQKKPHKRRSFFRLSESKK